MKAIQTGMEEDDHTKLRMLRKGVPACARPPPKYLNLLSVVLFFQPDQPQPSGQLDQGSREIIAIQQKQPRPALGQFYDLGAVVIGVAVPLQDGERARTGYGEIRGFWMNQYPDGGQFNYSIIIPESEVVDGDNYTIFLLTRGIL